MGCNSRRVMDGLGGLVKMSIGPVPIVHPHHHQSMKDRVPQLFNVCQAKLFGRLTVIGPKLIILITLGECVILPPELPLELGVVLSCKDQPMKTMLEDLEDILVMVA